MRNGGQSPHLAPATASRHEGSTQPNGAHPMPLFAIICTDKPGHLDRRLATRPAHKDYLAASGRVVHAGPFLRDGAMCGSLIVIEAEDRAAAEVFAAGDPFAQAGIFAETRIEEWDKVTG